MKKIFIFIAPILVIATGSCKKEQSEKPVVKAAAAPQLAKPVQNVVQTKYNYHKAIMAKHTVIK